MPELTVVNGSLDVSSSIATGGAIAVLGDRVALFDAAITAAGATGGGQVLVGGDYKGSGTVPNARRTLVDASSTIRADALDSGDGGRVILWADEATGFWGEISARGGENDGDGGFVEVSGKQQLIFEGDVDLTASAGQLGTLLLDPFNIRIVDSASPDDFEVGDGQVLLNDAPGDTLFISADALEGFSGSTLRLEAANDIVIDPDVELEFDVTLVGTVIFNADADRNGLGVFSMPNDSSIETDGANLTIFGAEINLGIVETSSDFGNSGSVTLIAETGSSSAGQFNSIEFNYIDTSNEDGFAAGNISIFVNGTVLGTGTNDAGNTLDAVGDAGGGLISIQYNGGELGLPLTIGGATLNGFAGGIETNNARLEPNGQTITSITAGEITINFVGDDILDQLGGDFIFNASPDNPENGFNNAFLAFDDSTALDFGFEDFDGEATEEFSDHFGDLSSQPVSLTDMQQVLSAIAAQTSELPAIVYIRYAPAIAYSPDPSPRVHTPAVTANQVDQLLAIGSRELWRFDGSGHSWDVPLVSQGEEGGPPGNPDDVLEIAVVFGSGSPVRRLVPGVTRADVERVAGQLRRSVTNPRRRNAFRQPARQLYEWLIAPVEAELEERGVTNLAFILTAGLRSLPMAALNDGEQFLIERYSLGLMPSLSLTDTNYQSVQDLSVLAMGASEFADQAPLPAVPAELEIITQKLWPGESLLNEEFTPNNLRSARAQTGYGIVHLGTHGEFQPGRTDESFIWFGNGRLSLAKLRELNLNQPPTELLVLSACRTALGDREAELGFAGLAVQSGVKTALGSLWYVSDSGTLAFMTNFYDQLQEAPIKAEALRQAQLALIRGATRFEGGQLVSPAGRFDVLPELARLGSEMDLSHPYFWSAFTMIGSPW
ncbi:MAG: CHAT domain-containing protein [Spirulinaceae cyanobacterium SM2_1_0]|nr:CHAT domain-containing protein [Spirulinaceae cyanobacterium SM2_1_0]